MLSPVTTLKIASSLTAVFLAATLSAMLQQAALAGPSHTDYFSRSTGSQEQRPTTTVSLPAPTTASPKVVAEQWFQQMDVVVARHLPTPTDQDTLNQDFGQKVEKVIAWSQACAKVASSYHDLAHQLRAMPIPQAMQVKQGRTSVAEMRNMEAQWYEDSANYLEDWIRPRKPAVTREELQRDLDQMDQRSKLLVTRQRGFQTAEIDVRNQFGVEPPRYDDALRSYVNRIPTN
jgi:hypothetical protein